MKRPIFFIAIGMLLAFAMLAGVLIIASNALAGTRLREFGNGDIDVNIAFSRPTATLPIIGNQSRAGNAASDALRQRELEYEEKLREVVRVAQTVLPNGEVTAPAQTATAKPTATSTAMPIATAIPTATPAQPPSPQPAASTREDDQQGTPSVSTPAPVQPPQLQQAAPPPAPTADDHGGNRNTPEPAIQPQPPFQPLPPLQPAPTDDHGGSNSGPSGDDTPEPPESNDDSSNNSGRDKPPEPPKEPKP